MQNEGRATNKPTSLFIESPIEPLQVAKHMSLPGDQGDQQLQGGYKPPSNRRKFKPKAKTGCHTCR